MLLFVGTSLFPWGFSRQDLLCATTVPSMFLAYSKCLINIIYNPIKGKTLLFFPQTKSNIDSQIVKQLSLFGLKQNSRGARGQEPDPPSFLLIPWQHSFKELLYQGS